MEFIANLLSTIGSGAADAESNACIFVIFDEPECPKSLIK
ncbi:MAG: cyclic lactone autoinducer peptide [Bacilli bacterium]|nr:cyclic lactone autoinducer peptide [Bacilli bacterium]